MNDEFQSSTSCRDRLISKERFVNVINVRNPASNDADRKKREISHHEIKLSECHLMLDSFGSQVALGSQASSEINFSTIPADSSNDLKTA